LQFSEAKKSIRYPAGEEKRNRWEGSNGAISILKGAAKELIQSEQPRKMTFNLNHEAGYDSRLISAGLWRFSWNQFCPSLRHTVATAQIAPVCHWHS
jgi:hypothetical protein